MPVAVPNSNSFYNNNNNYSRNNRYREYDDNKMINPNYNNYSNNNYVNKNYSNRQSFSRYHDFEEKNNIYEYLNRLEQRNKRLENINNIFLNMLREQKYSNYNDRYLNRNRSMENIAPGSYPYLSYDKYGNKKLLYLDRDSVNNNKIINGNYKESYLVPLFPKDNSVAEKNKALYLLNNEKLKYYRNDLPYFYYNANSVPNIYKNIPQKVNSVQYANKQMIYKKFNSNEKNIKVTLSNKEDDYEPIKIISKRNNDNNSEILNEKKIIK